MLAAVVGAATAPSAAEGAVAKGIVDAQLEAESATSPAKPGLIREIDQGLDAEWVRLSVAWSTLEPTAGAYAAAELERLDALVSELHTAGVKVILATSAMPAWAQDSSLWQHPPSGVAKGPQPFYVIRKGALDDYGRLGRFLAARYKGRVQALECWNEPNLWTFLYPQRISGDAYYAPRMYLRMLRAFHAGVHKGSGGRVRVIAGATAPVGLNDVYRTSPQRFARFLRRAGAGRYFDVYSHHPYTPGGSLYHAPGRPPNDPSTTVTLYNLGTLLRLFPRKPFYLTEYGYSTQPSAAFGGFAVTEKQQARYLRQAYQLAARYEQVKVLVWFLLRDQKAADPGLGVYSGLRGADGGRKPSWYAFRAL
jgi:hypothetical protein